MVRMRYRISISILIALMLVLCVSSAMDSSLEFFDEKGKASLNRTLKNASYTFLTFRLLNAGVSLIQGTQVHLQPGVGSLEELRHAPLGEALLAPLLGADQLPHERHRRDRPRQDLRDRVELDVGPVEVAGDAEQIGQEAATVGIGRVAADLGVHRLDGLAELAGTEQFVSVHGFGVEPQMSRPAKSSVTSLTDEVIWSS